MSLALQKSKARATLWLLSSTVLQLRKVMRIVDGYVYLEVGHKLDRRNYDARYFIY